VKPARDIRRRYDVQNRFIIAHSISAKSLAHVGVEIDMQWLLERIHDWFPFLNSQTA
jgi:hypothetical protein